MIGNWRYGIKTMEMDVALIVGKTKNAPLGRFDPEPGELICGSVCEENAVLGNCFDHLLDHFFILELELDFHSAGRLAVDRAVCVVNQVAL